MKEKKENKENNSFYVKRKNIKSNKLINPLPQNHKNIIKKIKTNIFSPSSNSNKKKFTEFIKLFHSELSNKTKSLKSPLLYQGNNLRENLQIFNKTLNEVKIERPKIKIKINSTEHNNMNKNTISTEKNNNPIKCKIHKFKPKNLKCIEKKVFSPAKLNKDKSIKVNNTKYKLLNTIQNSLDDSGTNINCKKKEFPILNYYYNILQEKHLKALNSNIENLIKDQSSSITSPMLNITSKNNIIYQNKFNKNKALDMTERNFKKKINKINHWRKIIYRKKIYKKKNNCSETFSSTILNIDKQKDIKDINKTDNKKGIDNYFSSLNTMDKFQKIRIINKDINQTPIKLELPSNNTNGFERINYCQKNSSILFPKLTLKEKRNKNRNLYSESKNLSNNDYIKIENDNDNDNYKYNYNHDILLDNNTESESRTNTNTTTNKKIESYNFKKKYYTIIRDKESNNFKSPKLKEDPLINSSRLTNYKDKDKEKYENSINYFINNNWNNNINNNYLIGYNNNSNEFETLNDTNLNPPRNNIIDYFDKNIKVNQNQNLGIYGTYSIPNFDRSHRIKKFIKKDDINKKKLMLNNSGNKKLRNVVTSIEFRNSRNNIGREFDDKNIILSEVDNDGRLNIKVKEMKTSIEKVIRENSNQKNYYYMKTPQKPSDIKYVKKNQGTHISKNKNYNTIKLE